MYNKESYSCGGSTYSAILSKEAPLDNEHFDDNDLCALGYRCDILTDAKNIVLSWFFLASGRDGCARGVLSQDLFINKNQSIFTLFDKIDLTRFHWTMII
jgi:hypothetical protein